MPANDCFYVQILPVFEILIVYKLRVVPTPPRPRMVARVVTTLQLFAAETCNKFLKIEHHDSIVYSKHELILTFLAGATSDFTAGNTTQERLDLPARFLNSRYHTLPCYREFWILLFHLPIFSEIPE